MTYSFGPLEIENGKYTFYIPENDYRVHILRCGEPWVIVEAGSKAIAYLLYELEELKSYANKNS